MKKKIGKRQSSVGMWRKILRVMKLSMVFIVGFVFNLSATTYSQKLDLKMSNASLKEVMDFLHDKTDCDFFYDESAIKEIKSINIEMEDATLEKILEVCLSGTSFNYRIVGKTIIIHPKEKMNEERKEILIQGVVKDVHGMPLPGVTIRLDGTSIGTSTDVDGNYSLVFPVEKGELIFSFVGFKQKKVAFNGNQTLNIILEEDMEEMDEVVVTGMFERRAESFTGSAVTVKRDDLLKVGNQNLLRSLSNIDPSFRIMESLEFGSDPNRTPEVQLRGKGSFPNLEGTYSGNPNEPLFILDGFETTVEKVFDLDMNRVESVTILKDAAAKAIYGSKAGNGVVVIETIRPKMGELKIYYNGSLDLEAPDLTGYNLMNAKEKFDFEVERGMYADWGADKDSQNQNILYEEHFRNVVKGYDTYWLSKPLRVGTTNKHSLQFEGGDATMRYRFGVNYNTIKGVMKGSERNNLTINTTLSYTFKNVIFRNILEFNRNKGINSPYGSFSTYTALNPYYSPYDDEGNLVVELGRYQDIYYNPLYNATLNTKSETGYISVNDNFYIEWNVMPELKVTGRFSYNITKSDSEEFIPPGHTQFMKINSSASDQSPDKKGFYTKGYGETHSIQSDIGLNFSKRLNKHFFFLNGTWNLADNKSITNSYSAEGFGNDNMNDISFALQYAEGTTPIGSDNHTREIGLVGAFNYSFDDRYLFDASIRYTGSSVYGSKNKWGQFWSLGIGWNIHHENFMKNLPFEQLKLRGSMGYTGTQNFFPFQSRARYDYYTYSYDGKYGAYLMGLPNEKLKWQRNMDYTVGLDISILKNINIKADYYLSVTDDLLSDLSLPSSAGYSSYKENLGKVKNYGVDITVNYTPWRESETNSWVTITASALHNKNKIMKIHDIFKNSNDEQNDSKDNVYLFDGSNLQELREKYTRPSSLYYEGQSMTAIWGVKSGGIDPMRGIEMFYDKEGNLKSLWSSEDQVIIGDTEPKLQGSIGLSAGYKGITLNLNCSYKFGGDIYNITLVDKVENADGRDNLDKRVLKTWRKPGDIAPYKEQNISYTSYHLDPTRPTSRFVQKNNELYFSSINVGYDFYKMDWIKTIGLQRLKFTFYMNEILRLSSVKQERGLSYPFARNFSFSLQATF